MLGSYFYVRGISFIFGGYPNEVDLLKQLKHKVFASIPWSFYLYFAIMIGSTVLGIVVQVKRLNKKKEKKKEKKEKGGKEKQDKKYHDMEKSPEETLDKSDD
jgi:hypothetical protein